MLVWHSAASRKENVPVTWFRWHRRLACELLASIKLKVSVSPKEDTILNPRTVVCETCDWISTRE